MDTSVEKNKRIAKNTIFLYIRMLLIMAVTLYTSRVILQVLGVEDFGIYNVVGGVATSFVFFSSSLSNATQRFLNFELGCGRSEEVRNVFNISLLIYGILAILVVVVSEIVGVWLINDKLQLPADRLETALWVFHVTIVSLAITLIGSVFDSVLIARENMRIYAYMGIFEAIGKLIVVYILNYAPFDKLKLYSFLLLTVTLLTKSVPILLCIRKYPECKLGYYWNRLLFVRLFKFVGWNGFGTAVWAINEQGMTILLNIFFGPIVNAARAVAAQVNAAINNFSSNFFVAVRPQIVNSYANKNYEYFIELVYNSSRYSFYLMWILCLPILLNTDYILSLWLKTVPHYTPQFVQWILLYSLVNVLTNPFWSAIQAVGKLQRYILIGCSIYLMAFPISYILLMKGCNPVVPFQVLTIIRLFYLFITIWVVKKYVDFSMTFYLKKVIRPILVVVVISFTIMFFVNIFLCVFDLNLWHFVLISIISLFVILLVVYLFGINSMEKILLKNKFLYLIK